ncbi:PGF-pre-PGF domain-containing protein [Methanorbis rubei]|uniref:PGF-pre-PGF domain-containing protein n=1 Tax=Methanorbis rubei TaxID=3028300 RepID=UPI0030B89C35
MKKISCRSWMQYALLLCAVLLCACVLFTAPVAASPDDAFVFNGGTFATAQALAVALGSAATAADDTLTLNQDLLLTGPVNITGSMTIIGNGHTIWRGGNNFFLINVSVGILTLGGPSDILIINASTDEFYSNCGLIQVTGSGSELIMNDGVTITGDSENNFYEGGSVCIVSGGNFTMHGGNITDNWAGTGGGVYVSGGSSFTMYGGNITDNRGSDGGGVYVTSGSSFTMHGGNITGNRASGSGGGVRVSDPYPYTGSFFTMDGGKIFGNRAGDGGGVYVGVVGNFTMNGGEIFDNIVTQYGGGVRVYGLNAVFTMNNGKIFNNTAQYGGGVDLEGYGGGSFTMGGGEISGNTATNKGGGIRSSGDVTIDDGEISGNTAQNGGGAFLYGNSFTMHAGKISGNTGSTYAAIGFEKLEFATTSFLMTGGEISHNIAKESDGAAIGFNSSNPIVVIVTITDGSIIHNQGHAISQSGGLNTQGTYNIGGTTLFLNNTGSHFYMKSGDATLNLTGGEYKKGENTVNLLDTSGKTAVYLSGPVTFDADLPFTLNSKDSTVTVNGEFTGMIHSFNPIAEDLDNVALITVDNTKTTQKPSELLSRFALLDTKKWTLVADDNTDTIKTVINKPIALAGSGNVTVTWINATVANVSIRLDPNANDATDVYVRLGSSESQKLSGGTFVKGSTISDLQVTGLTAGTSYSVAAVLKNTGISSSEFTSSNLLDTTSPTPHTVTITGTGGAPLPDGGANLGQGKSMTFGVLVYDASDKLLKDEPVTWSKTGAFTIEGTKTATTITLTGGSSDGTDTLTATAGGATGTASISVTTDTPTKLTVNADKQTIALGDSVSLTPIATDNGGKQFAGYDVEWTVSPSGTIADSKTGAAAAFTPTVAGSYTITASVSDPSLTAQTTITVVAKPTITTQPQSATYIKGQTAAQLTVTASGAALGYQWQKSTDPSFNADVSTVGTNSRTYPPDISTAGTTYYRVNVTNTQNDFVTHTYSSAAMITVLEPTADKIELNKTSVTIQKEGAAAQITATAKNTTLDTNLDTAVITWSIETGGEYVSITQAGNTVTITGKQAGTAVISASSGSAAAKATVIVTDQTVTTHTITASAGTGGSINPNGEIPVVEGSSQGFTITPDTGYEITNVIVDGTSVDAVNYYKFDSVMESHTIAATFTATSYTITASAGPGGSISPSGAVTAAPGDDKSFTITAATGYKIADVKVDGTSVGAASSHTIENIQAACTIRAEFSELPPSTVTITATAGPGGSISPSGAVSVTSGDDKSFSINPADGYKIADVKVDGRSVGAVSSYTIQNIVADHTIAATFTGVPTPVPTGGGSSDGGYSGSTSAGISLTGSVSFGSSVGFTSVDFPQGTTGTVVLNTKPSGIPEPQNSYLVSDISAPSFQGSAQVEFSVPAALIRDQGLGVNDVVLRHYVNGEWVNLPTFFIGEERGAAHYVATTSSFSPFAIVYEKGGASTVEKSTPQPTVAAGTAAATSAATASATNAQASAATPVPTNPAGSAATAAPTLTQAPVPVAGALFGLLAACVMLRRRN